MNKRRDFGKLLLSGMLMFSTFLGLGVITSQAETITATFADIPMYRIICNGSDADLETLAAKCANRSLKLSKAEDGRLATEWDIDYRSMLHTDEQLQILGATTEISIKGFAYRDLLKDARIPKQKFATFTDLMTPPAAQETAVSSESVYKNFVAVSDKKGVTRKDRIAAIANDVDQLRFRTNDAYSQYLVAMFHYMTGQELKEKYPSDLQNVFYLPISADMNRHFLTAYMHMDACAKIAGPMQEEAAFERAMITYYARKQGDEVFRIQQCLADIDRSIKDFPGGKLSFRLSVQRLEVMKDLSGVQSLSPELREKYKADFSIQAEATANDPRIIPDPKSYEQMLAVIMYSEAMYFDKKYSKVTEYYQSKFANMKPSELPASTYWMFANLWNVDMYSAEFAGDWKSALNFVEMRLATPPAEGKAWPIGDPKENKLDALRKAALYSKNLGDSTKEKNYTRQADKLEKEIRK